MVDSFDSSNPLYSTSGQWDVNKRLANGSVGTDGAVANILGIGNGNIYGKVMTGPGSVQSDVNVGSQGAVGDATWNGTKADQGNIESGYCTGNFNVNIPDVPTPPTGSALPAANNGVITLNGGTYTAASDPGTPLLVTAPTTLWVKGSYSPGVGITITNGGSLVLYVGTATGSGDSMSMAGNGAMNYPGYAQNLQIYGLPSLTGIAFGGNAGFVGTIYAPEAAVTGGGGGNNEQDTSGAIIANSVTMNGHWNFHYDQNLTNSTGPSRGWIAKSWTEQKYP